MKTRRRRAFLRFHALGAKMLFAAATVALFAARCARAQDSVFTLDPAQTRIEFTLPAELHTVHGNFKLKSGAIRFDTASGAASGAIIVNAASGDSGNHGRDAKMHREILESAKFAEIVFTPRKISGPLGRQGPSQIEVAGVLTLHGEDHDVTLTMDIEKNGETCKASTRFAIPYVKWGLKNPSTFFLRVSKEVQIEIHASGTLSAPRAEP